MALVDFFLLVPFFGFWLSFMQIQKRICIACLLSRVPVKRSLGLRVSGSH